MRLQTSIDYEALARRLGLDRNLNIDLVEVDNITGTITLVVSGDVPRGCVNTAGFYPSPKGRGRAPDTVYFSSLQGDRR